MHGYFASLMTNSIQGFNYKKNIVIDNSGLNEQLNNIQIKVVLNSANFDFTKAKTDGSDIRFYKGIQELNYYKESYNTATQTAVFYVKVNISSATNDNIQIDVKNKNSIKFRKNITLSKILAKLSLNKKSDDDLQDALDAIEKIYKNEI